jgi:hypothetical protein
MGSATSTGHFRLLGKVGMSHLSTSCPIGNRDVRDRSMDNRHLQRLVESIIANMGDPPQDAKESDQRETKAFLNPLMPGRGSQSGHSTLSRGKPDTWGRATACRRLRRYIPEC